MDVKNIISRLNYNALIIEELVTGIPEEQARWKPVAEQWCVLEVINHLYDEEKDDFRTRLDYTLHRPGYLWPPIDPVGWVKTHNYMGSILHESKVNFLAERTKSISWLESLRSENWDIEYKQPGISIFKAGDLLVSWLAHDYRHIRQLANLNVLYTEQLAPPYSTKYASP